MECCFWHFKRVGWSKSFLVQPPSPPSKNKKYHSSLGRLTWHILQAVARLIKTLIQQDFFCDLKTDTTYVLFSEVICWSHPSDVVNLDGWPSVRSLSWAFLVGEGLVFRGNFGIWEAEVRMHSMVCLYH